MEAGTVPEKAIISHRGEKYEIGRGKRFYGIWVVGAPYEAPVDRWPETREGWEQSWSRFATVEVPGTIAPVPSQRIGLGTMLKSRRATAESGAGPAGGSAGSVTGAAVAGRGAARGRGGGGRAPGRHRPACRRGTARPWRRARAGRVVPRLRRGAEPAVAGRPGRAAPVLRDRLGDQRRADRAERVAAESGQAGGAVRPRA